MRPKFKLGNESFDSVEDFKYLETTVKKSKLQ